MRWRKWGKRKRRRFGITGPDTPAASHDTNEPDSRRCRATACSVLCTAGVLPDATPARVDRRGKHTRCTAMGLPRPTPCGAQPAPPCVVRNAHALLYTPHCRQYRPILLIHHCCHVSEQSIEFCQPGELSRNLQSIV